MDWHDQQDLTRYRRRKRKQQDYQANYRAKLAEAKTPERDDVSAVLMAAYLDVLVLDSKAVVVISRRLVDGLVARGYDRHASKDRIRAMARRVQTQMQAKGKLAASE
ncbi:hypothetical protein MKK68_00315 [Methylobacterium sp. E-016]|uniref:hypothetical protein n=1 Tax=Methylobacterium sp. E-016 TaxID=2836556 RepID=UPI001FB938CB|nr:hypothetical protein [Methylobacterium sp. E-016]MCJ2074106.1 hypothetical protein [Methylobacterium sp. E-016]